MSSSPDISDTAVRMPESFGRPGSASGQMRFEGAAAAQRKSFATVLLGYPDEQGVGLVVQQRLARQTVLQEAPDLLVRFTAANHTVPRENSTRIGIHDEGRTVGGVQHDRIGRLGPDPGDGQKLRPQRREALTQKTLQVATMPCFQMIEERPQSPRLLAVEPGRSNQPGDPPDRRPKHPPRIEQTGTAERGDSLLDVGPGDVLSEDGTDDDLERRPGGPPSLRPIRAQEGVIVGEEGGSVGEPGHGF